MIHYRERHPEPTEYGTLSRVQTAMLMGIASGQQGIGTHVLEFGTLAGSTTTNLARILPLHQVFTVSLPQGVTPSLTSAPDEMTHYGTRVTFPDDVRPRITHIECDSAHLALGPCALGLVFVDGGHSREYVLNDFHKALPHLVSGSVVVFHDYGIDNSGVGITGVKEAVDELIAWHESWRWTVTDNGLAWGKFTTAL